ncbi:hypothetical protein Tco_0571599 [Tanacetum coccineum]
MAAPAITISSDVSEESVTSVVSRVILFGTIPIEIPIVPDMPTDLPTTPELPAVSPFLCLDDPESESTDELLERHVSLRLHDDVVARWRDSVRSYPFSPSGSSSLDTTIMSIEIAIASPAFISTPVIIASPAVRSRIRTTVRQSTLGLQPVMTPAYSTTLRRACRAALSLETSSFDTSSGSSSYLALVSSSSVRPSRKRSRGTSAMHSNESGDEGSPETQTELNMDSDIWADIKAAIMTDDGLGIEPVMTGVETDIRPELAAVETESEPMEAEADDEANVEVQPEDTIEIGVDIATGIDIPNDLIIYDAIE